jgi:hypothetical protein
VASGTDVMNGEGDMLVFDNFADTSIDLRAFTDAQLAGIEVLILKMEERLP